MELRHMRYFVAVAEELHIGRAARRLHLAQPPLSRQIHDLEAEIGVALLRRAGRGIQLTEAGKVFLEGARQTLAASDHAVRMARRAAHGAVGELAIGCVSAATAQVLPNLLRSFRAAYPDVTVRVMPLTSREQLVALREGRIALGLLRLPTDDASLAQLVLRHESLLVMLPDSHPLAAVDHISLSVLAHEPLIIYPRADNPAIYDTIIGYCRQAGFSPTIVQEASEGLIMQGLVASGLGIALRIGAATDTASLASAGVVVKPLTDALPGWEMALVWRQDDSAPVVQRFLEVARQALARTGD